MIKSLNLFVLALASMAMLAGEAYAQRGPGRPGPHRPGPGGGFGVERFVIDMGDEVHRQSSTLPLKMLIQRNYGHVDLPNMELQSVRLVAKSARGYGQASLYVGNRFQDQANIGGYPGDFQDDRPYTFDRLDLNSYERGPRQGAWQVELQGRIKVRRLVITARYVGRPGPGRPGPGRPGPGRPGPGRPGPEQPGPGVYQSVKEIKLDKFIGEDKEHNVSLQNVRALRVTGKRGTADVSNITVTFGNGQKLFLSELTGYVREGEILVAPIGGRNIISIRVAGKSPNLFGPSARIELGAVLNGRR